MIDKMKFAESIIARIQVIWLAEDLKVVSCEIADKTYGESMSVVLECKGSRLMVNLIEDRADK